MKRSAEVYLTQDGKTYRLYADVEEQLYFDGSLNTTTVFKMAPLLKSGHKIKVLGPFDFNIEKSFDCILIQYNTYTLELIDCNITRECEATYGPTAVLELRCNKINTVGMWHALDWELENVYQ